MATLTALKFSEPEGAKAMLEKVTEGSSALFLLTSDAVKDKVVDSLKGTEFEIIASNLTGEQEEELQAAFGQE